MRSKSNFIYGIWQDKDHSISELVIKDANDKIVTRIEHPLGSRSHSFTLNDRIFHLERPLVWKGLTINLKDSDGNILASFKKTRSLLLKYQLFIKDTDHLELKYSGLDPRQSVQFIHKNVLIGETQNISRLRRIGHMGYFLEDFPLETRVFLIAIFS